jgi:hypothetical protein
MRWRPIGPNLQVTFQIPANATPPFVIRAVAAGESCAAALTLMTGLALVVGARRRAAARSRVATISRSARARSPAPLVELSGAQPPRFAR